MRFAAFDIDDKTDAASFMLELRVVKPLPGGRPGFRERFAFAFLALHFQRIHLDSRSII
jgi:hypothetical protein